MGKGERPGWWDGSASHGTARPGSHHCHKLGQVSASSHSTSKGQPQGWVRQRGWATLYSDRAVTAARPCPGRCPASGPRTRAARGDGPQGRMHARVRVSSANGRVLPRDGEHGEVGSRSGCPPKLVLVQEVGGDTLASCHPSPPIPGQERWEPGLRLYTLALLTPLYKTAFPALFYKPTTHPRGGQGGQRGPHNQGAPGCCSPTPSHLRWGLGGGGSGGVSPGRVNTPPELWGAWGWEGMGWGGFSPKIGHQIPLPLAHPASVPVLPQRNNK